MLITANLSTIVHNLKEVIALKSTSLRCMTQITVGSPRSWLVLAEINKHAYTLRTFFFKNTLLQSRPVSYFRGDFSPNYQTLPFIQIASKMDLWAMALRW